MATVEQSLSQLVDAVSVHDGEPQTRSVQVHDALSSERIQADHRACADLFALYMYNLCPDKSWNLGLLVLLSHSFWDGVTRSGTFIRPMPLQGIGGRS